MLLLYHYDRENTRGILCCSQISLTDSRWYDKILLFIIETEMYEQEELEKQQTKGEPIIFCPKCGYEVAPGDQDSISKKFDSIAKYNLKKLQ